ncbi:DUF922 domain-containing protein [Aureimonas sp. ME7]|uniref:DUF922 domain-containing protein n=1 Tax=Aureimonas sp. ME7 TaxID=2744252 RepID=UPI0015F3A394|nr:DUF922 domain-containing protein [Aureimonas sp. ME7]
MRRLLFSCLAAGFLTPGLAFAGSVTERTTYFMVKGSTFAEIDRALGLKGPLLSGRERRAGATEVSFTGDFQYQAQKLGCALKRTNLRLDLHTTLPRWNAPSGADAQTKAMWKVLHKDIATHEAKHGEIAKSWLRRMEKELIALPPSADCAKMEAIATRRSNQLLLAHEKAQRDFDMQEAKVVDARLRDKLNAEQNRRVAAAR